MSTGSKRSPDRGYYVPRHAPTKGGSKRAPVGSKDKKKSFIRRRWWLFVLITPVLLAVLGVLGLYIAYARIQIPDVEPPVRTTYVYDRNGKLLTTLHASIDRTTIPLDQISQHMIDAVIATEDHEFFEHQGVDLRGIIRAAWINLRGTDNEVQGASTITQQVVKNVYAGTYETDPETGLPVYIFPERSVTSKVREALLALKLEDELGKDRILAMYLNTVYFGNGAYGIEAAARTYFNKSASGLSVLESATLAGVLHAPDLYDPIDRPYDNEFRRDYSLEQMVRYGYLDETRAERLKEQDCCGTVKDAGDTERLVAPYQSEYFVDHVRRELFDLYGEARVYGGGMKVTTTLDIGLQQEAEQAIEDNLYEVSTDPSSEPAAALVAIDTQTGEILAMAGGRDWEKNKVNYATGQGGSGRQAGSAFKLFTLAAAIQEGYDLNAYWYGPSTITIPDCPDSTQPDGAWHPVNAEGSGNYSLAGATANSVNTIFAQLISQLGPEKVVDMAHDLGIRSNLPEVCAITLGSVGVNPLEMTNAYATVATGGERHWATPLISVEMPNGKVESGESVGEQVLDENDAALVTYALQGVISDGTGGNASLPGFPVAGKTGTADENKDVWFCGFTAQITACVWIGYPQGEIPLEDIGNVSGPAFGGQIPATIWQDFMTEAMAGLEPVAFPEPSFDGYSVGPLNPAPSPVPTLLPCASLIPSVSPTPCITPSPSPRPSPSPTPSPSPSKSPKPTETEEPSETPGPTESETPFTARLR